jgi:hypothetical protein
VRYSDIQISQWEEKPVATKKAAKKEPFGGKRATPFGKKDDDEKDAKKKPAKKTSRGK